MNRSARHTHCWYLPVQKPAPPHAKHPPLQKNFLLAPLYTRKNTTYLNRITSKSPYFFNIPRQSAYKNRNLYNETGVTTSVTPVGFTKQWPNSRVQPQAAFCQAPSTEPGVGFSSPTRGGPQASGALACILARMTHVPDVLLRCQTLPAPL